MVINLVVEAPLAVAIVVVVQILLVFEGYIQTYHHFVEGLAEVAL